MDGSLRVGGTPWDESPPSLHDGDWRPTGSGFGELAAAEAVDDILLALDPCRIFPRSFFIMEKIMFKFSI